MKVLVGLSGGVDSSMAAALLIEQGHEVVGVTLKLWGGAQDSGCCSVGDVEDARRVAQQLGIAHHVFNFTDEFDDRVVAPYVADHARGLTPNPCVECNRHLKFDRLLGRADHLGFDTIATGHHARIAGGEGRRRLLRGADRAKDQSYVLHMLGQAQLGRVQFPVGALTKVEVRERAASLGLRTAAKAESQDTCFITASGGREAFLRERIPLQAGRVVDTQGRDLGDIPAVELVTVGQRRGLGGGSHDRRYAIAVDVDHSIVVAGSRDELLTSKVAVEAPSWVWDEPSAGSAVEVQMSAHGAVASAIWDGRGVRFDTPQIRPAPGQSLVLYDPVTADEVLGGGIAGSSSPLE